MASTECSLGDAAELVATHEFLVMTPKTRGKGTATLKDISAAVGLSIPSVSRILNNPRDALLYSEETRERVREAAARLGYRPNRLAKAVRQNETRQVGIIVHHDEVNTSASYHSMDFITGITQQLERSRYSPLLVPMKLLEKAPEEVEQVFAEKFADAFIVLAYINERFLAAFERAVSEPTIWCDCNVRDDHFCLWRDEFEAGKRAADKLRTRYGRVMWLERQRREGTDHAYAIDRWRGANEVFTARGDQVRRIRIAEGDRRWREEFRALLRDGYDCVASEYTYLFMSTNEAIAEGMVPGRDFRLTCADDLEFFERFFDGVSRATFNRIEMGRQAAEMALQAIRRPGSRLPSTVVRPGWIEGNTAG